MKTEFSSKPKRKFVDFLVNASREEKDAFFLRVAKAANKEQQAMFAEAKHIELSNQAQ